MKYYLGCDVGSLTAKAVILDVENRNIVTSHIMPSLSTGKKSNQAIVDHVLDSANLKIDDINRMCSTGYGRFENVYSSDEKSEISCHGMGAFWSKSSIRTIIDIRGQDSKVISIADSGLIDKFKMNDKCAAGTGRILEIFAKNIGISIEEMGNISLKRKSNVYISNRCGIFMEMDVIKHLRSGKKTSDIIYAIADAVASRVAQLVNIVGLKSEIAITGGVSKNDSIVKRLERILNVKFAQLPFDPQLIGAIGAAVYAHMEDERGSHD